MTTKFATVNILNLKVGQIVHFYSARFEIVSAEVIKYDDRGTQRDVMIAVGKWLDGQVEQGYFGPNKDWVFQGNDLVQHCVEV